MFTFIENIWAQLRARWLVASARSQLEKRLSAYQVEHVVSDRLTLTTYDLGVDHDVTSWDGEAYFPFWTKRLQVSVYPEDTNPSEDQIDLLRKLLIHPYSIRENVLTAFAGFYNRRIFSELDNDPVVHSINDIYALVGDPTVVVDQMSKSDPVKFALSFLPMWRDTETRMQIVNWAIDDPLFNDLGSPQSEK